MPTPHPKHLSHAQRAKWHKSQSNRIVQQAKKRLLAETEYNYIRTYVSDRIGKDGYKDYVLFTDVTDIEYLKCHKAWLRHDISDGMYNTEERQYFEGLILAMDIRIKSLNPLISTHQLVTPQLNLF